MASGQGILASTGASFANVANFTASLFPKLPPGLQSYVDATVLHLTSAAEVSSDYIRSTTGLSPTTVYGTLAGAILLGALPTVAARASQNRAITTNKMDSGRSRYGWSSVWPRGPISPFGSGLGHDGQPPDVHDEDFSYITSEDLQDQSRYYNDNPTSSSTRVGRSEPALEIPDDDIILIKFKDIYYPEHFPAYSIADGKVLAIDIRERIQLITKLTDEQTDRLRLYYKGKELREDEMPAARYGIKNKSEVLAILPDDVGGGGSSESGEEIIVVDGDKPKPKSKSKSGRRGDRRSKTSPRDSNANLGVPEPIDLRPRSGSRSHSPAPPRTPRTPATPAAPKEYTYPPAAPGSAMETLNKIAMNFNDTLRPVAEEFVTNPPADEKKRKEEYLKITETILRNVIFKLDEVDTGGDETVRGRRKELVKDVQGVLAEADKMVPEADRTGR